jgi:hypothetical protein
VHRAETSIHYLGLVSKDYIATNLRKRFETISVWSHVRRCASLEDPFGRVGTYSVNDFLDGTRLLDIISISPGIKLFIQCPYMTRCNAW